MQREIEKREGMRIKIEKNWNAEQAAKRAKAARDEQDRIEHRRIEELKKW